MAREITPDGNVLYTDMVDLRGDQTHKNIEKHHGPGAILRMADGSLWWVAKCPLCNCPKSFDPEVPNAILTHCDGECPCHDGLALP